MTEIFWMWGISAFLIVLLAGFLGTRTNLQGGSSVFGILIDGRGRYSLTHLQLVMWSIIIFSLVSGVFWGRLIHGVDNPLSFTIPENVLGLVGISVGSALTAGVVKASKDSTENGAKVAASGPIAGQGKQDQPRFSQIFMLEEGENADRVIDVTKFQNFLITLILAVAYIALAINHISEAHNAGEVTSLPTFSGTFLILVGISHAGYVGGKLANQTGTPPGLTVANRAAPPAGLEPRNS
jgi:hypothetical protein